MMHFIFKNKKGVTILEGLIALGILAIVSVGIFGVLLSISRKSTDTDVREEMVLAVDRAYKALQLYSFSLNPSTWSSSWIPNTYPLGLCAGDGMVDNNPMNSDVWHDISCMLPPICDRSPNQSYFRYKPFSVPAELPPGAQKQDFRMGGSDYLEITGVEIRIKCNGFTL